MNGDYKTKICPILSKPSQGDILSFGGDTHLWESEEEMRRHGWTPINGIPFSGIIHCLGEDCAGFRRITDEEWDCGVMPE